MFNIRLIQHSDLTDENINEIIELKSKQWDFSEEQQLKWIKENIKNSDIHVLLSEESINVAYLNLIDISILVNGKEKKSFGVGNVCAIERGKGYGLKIMKYTNKFICESNKIGLLFCKNALINYYTSLGWNVLINNEINLNFKNTNVMIFNENRGNKIKYFGAFF